MVKKPLCISVSGRLRPLVTMAMVMGALILSGCGTTAPGDDEEEPAADGGVEEGDDGDAITLTFIHPEVEGSFAPLIESYEASHPGVKIDAANVPFDQLQSTLEARLSQGDPSIDIYTVDPSRTPAIVARDQLLEITDLLDEAEEKTLGTSLGPGIVDGQLWTLPIWTSSQYLYYNVDLLEQAGITPPSQDPAERWTWEEVTAAAQEAQAAGAEHGILIEQVNLYYQLQALPESLGGGSGLTGDDLLTPGLTNDGWLEAMSWYQDIHEEGIGPRGVSPAEMGPLFTAGGAAFYVGGPWVFPGFGESDVRFGFAPHPYFEDGEPVTPTDSWSWGISPHSEHPEEAKEFLAWAALTREGSLATIEEIFIPPTNIEAFDEYIGRLNTIVEGVSEGAGDLMLHELESTAVHRPPSPGYLVFEEEMASVFEDIRNGADIQERLSQAEESLSRAFERL